MTVKSGYRFAIPFSGMTLKNGWGNQWTRMLAKGQDYLTTDFKVERTNSTPRLHQTLDYLICLEIRQLTATC